MIAVLQATGWYPPRHMGGTEVYLTGLVRELRALNIGSRIIAPLGPEAADGYEFDGTVVRTYPVNPAPSRAELRGGTPQQGLERFSQILAEERPDIYHQHSWSGELGGAHLRAAREAGLKTVLTVHTPTAICLRGTMVRFGREACDGLIDPPLCGACWSHERGAPAIFAHALGAMPVAVSSSLARSIPAGRVARAFSARSLAERRKSEFARMVADADSIVAVCAWVFDALERNGVPRERLVLSRQGVDPAFAAEAAGSFERKERDRDGAFQLLYFGHWHPVKGIDVLIRAVRALPAEVGLKLFIHGVSNCAEDRDYAAAMRRLAAGDPRIAFEPPIPRPQLAATLSRASALAVPSLWLETGPLVVLEAKAAGLPIIGSRLGGIAELVREPEDGMLVPPGDVMAWAAAIKTMASARPARALISELGDVRTMREVARDMATLYNSLC
jgi:glycosyltransferase involved in cell wall biosynthesis